ncbi:MAG: ribosome small subunit-dependent GTPase A [Bdellovibrionaceae bacterium]|nr:ribosome small subunit-dependent GTPase A [Pseudobdellovibrionaceae bacterium]
MPIDFEFLTDLGWDPHFSIQLASDEPGQPGRVISTAKRLFQVLVGPDQVLRAEVSGRFAHVAASASDFPSVGDWVMVEALDTSRGIIHRLLDRKTLLVRKVAGAELKEQVLAANVDTAFIVSSLNQDFNLRRIERYLTLILLSGARPVVLLTKADLCADPEPMVAEVQTLAQELVALPVSSRTGQGLDAVRAYLNPGSTSVLLGSSGVGKSTLINALFGAEVAKTGEIRDDDDKGRHTTTARHLLRSPTGALMIDTPGMRELQVWDDGQGIEAVFQDIESLALQCKFTDCLHNSEPGCRVREALASGTLTPDRLENYRKLQRETEAQRRKTDKVAAAAEKKKWKKISVEIHDHIKRKKRGENF